jgi:hypothetical protein
VDTLGLPQCQTGLLRAKVNDFVPHEVQFHHDPYRKRVCLKRPITLQLLDELAVPAVDVPEWPGPDYDQRTIVTLFVSQLPFGLEPMVVRWVLQRFAAVEVVAVRHQNRRPPFNGCYFATVSVKDADTLTRLDRRLLMGAATLRYFGSQIDAERWKAQLDAEVQATAKPPNLVNIVMSTSPHTRRSAQALDYQGGVVVYG